MKHRATPAFWEAYHRLPPDIQMLADQKYALLQENSTHPSLHFKPISRFWSVRIGLHYRALAVEHNESYIWFWIGSHAEYDRLIQ